MARLTKEKLVAIASEVTFATDAVGATPTVFEQTITCSILDRRTPLADEADRGSASPGAMDTTPSHNEVTIEQYLFGKSGAAGTGPSNLPLWLACGFKQTVVPATSLALTPNTNSSDMATSPSATVKSWELTTDGEAMLSTALGFRGNAQIILQLQQRARVRFEGRATYTKKSNKAAHGLTLPTEYSGEKCPLVVTGITFEIDGTEFQLVNAELSTNWEVVEDRTATASTSIDDIHLRRPKGQYMVLSVDFLRTEDLEVVLAKYSDTACDSSLTVNAVLGDGTDTVTITAPRGFFGDYTRTDGATVEFAVPISLAGNYGTGTGDDELQILYT